jgi:hypothetical protein
MSAFAYDHTTHTVLPTTTGRPGTGALYGTLWRMFPLAGSIRLSLPSPNAYREPPLPVSDSWSNDWRLSSVAPHIPSATTRGPMGGTDDTDSVGCAEVEAVARDVGVPLAAGGALWWEVATLATAALAPAMTTTPSAASAGAQRRPPKAPLAKPRRGRGSPPRPGLCPSLATRYAMSSTVTRRGGSGVTRCSISASCRSSVFTTPHLRS